MAAESHPDGRPEVIVCITSDAVTAVSPFGDIVPGDGDEVAKALAGEAKLVPLFSESQAQLRRLAGELRPRLGPVIPDLSRFYVVAADWGERHKHEVVAKNLDAIGPVETAYVKPAPVWATQPAPEVAATAAEPQLPTPDYTGLQGYLRPAPEGIDAFFAWTLPGGYGDGVQIIAVEEGYRCTHEDLLYNQGGMLNVAPDDMASRNHGTAVAGVVSGDFSAIGVTGICPGATFSGMAASGERGGSAAAIRRAADRLRPGDILLLELHAPGPLSRANALEAGGKRSDAGYVPLEYWADDFAAVRYATERGVIVVSAAGNGGQDLGKLDDLPGFKGTGWPNPFDRAEEDSGTILVGAGAAYGEACARARLAFSNWGACIDAQGWGEAVVTTGGNDGGPGDLQGGRFEDRWYTRTFNGTSSAAPIVAGALACVQGILLEAGREPLTPAQARAFLRETGTPQALSADGKLERVGSLPNLQELIPRALASSGGLGDYGTEPYSDWGMPVTILIGGGSCAWDGSPSDAPYGLGPHWRGPHWRGPHWRGPHWRGPHWRGPSAGAGPYSVDRRPVVPRRDGAGSAERRTSRRPGFTG